MVYIINFDSSVFVQCDNLFSSLKARIDFGASARSVVPLIAETMFLWINEQSV